MFCPLFLLTPEKIKIQTLDSKVDLFVNKQDLLCHVSCQAHTGHGEIDIK